MQRHRVLSGLTRARLLAVLRAADRPMDVVELASAVGVRPNSAREQLRQLHDAGLVAIAKAAPAGRGRPGLRYAAEPRTEAADPYRSLARALTDRMAALPDAAEASEAAGERWGREVVAAAGAAGGGDALGRIARILDEAGFSPEPPTAGDAVLRLRNCPFAPIEAGHLAVVCGVHLGFIRGALAELESPVDAVRLEPLVQPDLCLAHLAPRADG